MYIKQSKTREQAPNQQKIKINIQTLDGELDIEIKKNENRFIVLVILSKSLFFKESGRVWNGNTLEAEKVLEIAALIKESFEKPSLLRSLTINDGILVKIILSEEDVATKLNFTDFGNGTIEGELMKRIFIFIDELIQDSDLREYMKFLGFKGHS